MITVLQIRIFMLSGFHSLRNQPSFDKLFSMMISCQKIVTSLPFFQFTANLEQSRSRILNAQSVKLKFSLISTFYFTKTESKTKKSLAQLSHYCFEYRHCFGHTQKKTLIFCKKYRHQQNQEGLGTKRYIFWNYICVKFHAKFEVSSITLRSFRQEVILFPPNTQLRMNP